jgi:NSS family neurotransmitter:Na+ symporter
MAGAPREQWGSRLGFVLAAVGSAVGLGNMWRFSYLASEHGGGAFLLLYIGMTALIGLPVMLAELTVGRGSGRSPIFAFSHFGGRAWSLLGWLFVVTGFLIFSYYSVIAGWTLRYAFETVFSGFSGDPGERFGALATGSSAVAWHLGFVGITALVVLGGIRGGIERASVVLMPLLFALVVGIALYAATLDGAGAGYARYLTFEFREILSIEVLREAAGQAFFSLSLGMGVMITYASYLSPRDHLPEESTIIAGADFGVAFLAGLVVFPLIFALGLSDKVGESTVGALFITLPEAFATMGMAGRVVGSLFFVALAVAALTSAISILEVVVASAIDGLGVSRGTGVFIASVGIALLGIPSALSLDVLGLLDQVAGNLLLILGGLGVAVFVGWVMDDPVAEAERGAEGVRWFFLWRTLLRTVVPLVLVVVLASSCGATFDAIRALGG